MAATPPRRQPAAGPSTPAVRSPAPPPPAISNGTQDLWTDILRSADRAKALPRKNIVLLSERHRGRAHLLDKVVGKRRARQPLAIGYDLLMSDDRDDDTPPNTAVVIVLDWSKPSTMVRELLAWLGWVDAWAARAAQADPSSEVDEMHERLESHLQHYTEPAAASVPLTNYGAVLPLGQGSLTRNPAGVPILVVCTRADLMDAVGDEMGMKGGGWEERTDWIQQVLRTVCLAYGAALFYTAPTQPHTYAFLREYLFHRLYTVPPPLGAEGAPAPQRFPFPHRANVLDRDAVMVPAGWDSWGKITILREPFDAARVARAWDASAARRDDDEGIEDLWAAMIPDTERPAAAHPVAVAVTSEAEQAFLARQLDGLVKSDAKGVFRRAAEAVDERYGVVGPMGTGGLSLPGVERAMAEMESAAEDVGRHARKDSKAAPASPDRSTVQNEALHNFFQGLLAKKQGTASATPTPTKAAPKAAK
ncbi:unnamed protein product [Cutaneotrichosporon oleaginosum]